jgi:hypothetical protein
MADLLTSGSDRPPRRPLRAVAGWRAPGPVVAGLVALTAAVAISGALSVGPVRERVEVAGLDVRVLASTVAVRGASTDGVLRAALRNAGPRSIDLRTAVLELPGVVLQPVRGRLPRRLAPGDAVEFDVPFRVPACGDLAARGVVRLGITVQGRRPTVLTLPVEPEPADDGLDVAAFAAGCRPTSTPYVVALAVEQVSGQAQAAGATARGDLAVAVRNLGAPARLVSVTGEVPGVLFVSQNAPGGDRDVAAGERVTVPLTFVVPFCAQPPRAGRLLVTVRDVTGALRLLSFPAGGDAGVDLTLVFGACRAAG